MLRVEEYVREDGSVPFKDWFERLDSHAAVKVATAVTRLSLGNTSNVKWFSGHGELKVDWGPGYRVYLAKDGETLVLLFCGGTKKRQKGRYRDGVGAPRRIQSAQEGRPESRSASGAQGTVNDMTLTRDFKETVVARVRRDPKFARTLLDESATLFLNGEPEAARLLLRDLVNATVGFEALADMTDKPAKSLHRMLSRHGNPSMDNLAAIFDAVRHRLKVGLKAQTVKAA